MKYTEEQHITIQDLELTDQEQESLGSLKGLYKISSLLGWKTLYITAQGMLEIAAYVEQNRTKLEQEATQPITSLPEDRYYVQRLSDTDYQVKERLTERQNGLNDPIVREFGDQRHKAYAFAGRLNDYQRHLDERYGHWVRHAAVTEMMRNVQNAARAGTRPLPDLTPFRFQWYFPGLGSYRPCGQVYCGIPYESLPPLPEELFQGTLHWLSPLEKETEQRGVDTCHSDKDLQHIINSAQQRRVTLPEAFLQCMRSPELLEHIPSCTDCYTDLSAGMMIYPGDEEGYVIRFLIDRQGVIAWYLYLTPQGKEYILVGDPWPEYLEMPEVRDPWIEYLNMPEARADTQTIPTEEKLSKIEEEKALEVCALSFESFLYRFWLENTLWYKIVYSKGMLPFTAEEERYLSYYRP